MKYNIESIRNMIAIKGQIIRLFKLGKTVKHICFIMDCQCSYGTVMSFLIEEGMIEERELQLSKSDKERIKALFLKNKNRGHRIMISRLAVKLGKPNKAVAEYLKELGYEPKPPKRSKIEKSDKEEILKLNKQGKSNSEISEMLGISHLTINALIKRNKRSLWTPKQLEYLRNELEYSRKNRVSPSLPEIGLKVQKTVKQIYEVIEAEKLVFFSMSFKYTKFELEEIIALAHIRDLTKHSPEVLEHGKKYGRPPKPIMPKVAKERIRLNIRFPENED